MNATREVIRVPRRKRVVWFFVGLAVVGVVVTVVRVVYRGTPALADALTSVTVLVALACLAVVRVLVAEADADEYGLHRGKLLRRRSVPWHDVVELRVRVQRGRDFDIRSVSALLRDGREWRLALPVGYGADHADFDAKVAELRALHRGHGGPESDHVPVISNHTAGGGHPVGALFLCVLLLAGAATAASFVGSAAAHERAWKSATPCAPSTPVAERGECLTTLPAVIASTRATQSKADDWLYFTDSRPMRRLDVSHEAALAFRPGDRVELTVWRGQVMVAAGQHYVWREHVITPGSVAVLVALLALAAGYPAAVALQHLRARRLPDDEALPSAIPFAGVLVGTALWLLPYCYFHFTRPFSSPAAIGWAAAGTVATLMLFVVVWRATGIVVPGEAEVTPASGESGGRTESALEDEEEVFLRARFLEHTDYNPYGFGTHIVLGGKGPLAVTPHAGPGRFAAKTVPVTRLTVKKVRRPQGDEADIIPGSWHVAELDDAGEPVRLVAAPADLARILRRLGPAGQPASGTANTQQTATT